MKNWMPSRSFFLCFRYLPMVWLFFMMLQTENTHANILQDPQGFHGRANALRAKARSRGAVRVIVQFDEFGSALPDLSNSDTNGRLAVIKAFQNDILSRIDIERKLKHVKKFQYTPFVALEVDELGVFELEHYSHIFDIVEDRPDAPSLAQSVPLIKANTMAWDMGYTGAGQTIAIIDSGVDKNHPFLAGKVIEEACYSTNSSTSSSLCPGGGSQSTETGAGVNCTGASGCDHGTHVAGIAAGKDPGGIGYSGVAKDADIISVQVYSRFNDPADCGSIQAPCVLSWASDQKLALERIYALRDTRQIAAVNMSLGGGKHSSACDNDVRKTDIDNLRAVGIPVIAASGNSGYKTQIAAPACVSSVVSVGASCDYGGDSYCTTVDAVASDSNTAYVLSLMAPGAAITSSVPGGKYGSWRGTSMAAPHVAGAWALKKQENPAATVDQLLQYFQTNALTIDDTRSGGTLKGLKRIQFEATTSVLTLTKTGNGTVSSTPDGISCGSTCSAIYPTQTNVTLTASPGECYAFAGWGGACSGSGTTCTVSMAAAKNVSATFTAMPISTFYRDFDGDEYGDPEVSQSACEKPAGYVSRGGDCDDVQADVNPGMNEICEPYGTVQVDNNCDGIIYDSSIYDTYWLDSDGDGYGDGNAATAIQVCSAPPIGYAPAAQGKDDNDHNPECYPDSPQGTCSANDFASYLSTIHDAGAWLSRSSIVNTGAISTPLDLLYRDTTGRLIKNVQTTLDPAAQYSNLARNETGRDLTGSLTIKATEPTVGLTISQNTLEGRWYSVYGSITPARSILLPHINESTTAFWTGTFTVTNQGSTSTSVTLRFYDMNGLLVLNPAPVVTIAPGAQYRKRVMDVVGDGFKGSLHIDAEQPVTATFDQSNTSDFRYASYGSLTPSSTIYYPHVNAVDPWYSWFLITNSANSIATVSVYFYNFDGSLNKTLPLTLEPYASYGNQVWKMAGMGFRGYIKAISDQPVAGIQTFNNYADGRYGASGTPSPGTTIYFPYLVHKTTPSQGNWLAVVNAGTASTSIFMDCYNQEGTKLKTVEAALTPNQSYGNAVKNVCGEGFEGSIKVTSTQPMAGLTSFNDYVSGGYGVMEHVVLPP